MNYSPELKESLLRRMLHCKVEKHGENASLRQKGKQATLSCGYGGAEGALIAMGALDAGMKEEELGPLVAAWRAANPNIVQMWWAVDRAVKTAVKEKTITRTLGGEHCTGGIPRHPLLCDGAASGLPYRRSCA